MKKINDLNLINSCISNKMKDSYLKSKPDWIRIKLPTKLNQVNNVKKILKMNLLHSVCEEALCPNLHECFNNKTATFMILGNICTRKCPFCAVSSGRPNTIDLEEPKKLLDTVLQMKIQYVVITSVVRDDLKDGGVKQFVNCIKYLRTQKNIKIEILVPDFRNSVKYAIEIISKYPPDIFNHNIENVPRLYKKIRPGANYNQSLNLLSMFKKKNPSIPTKSGLMLGLGETDTEVIQVLQDLRDHNVNMLTIGQYLRPSINHLPVKRYVTPLEFKFFQEKALSMGFSKAFCGPLVRSSYHANFQTE